MQVEEIARWLDTKGACPESLAWLRSQPDARTAWEQCPYISWLEQVAKSAGWDEDNLRHIVRPAWLRLTCRVNEPFGRALVAAAAMLRERLPYERLEALVESRLRDAAVAADSASCEAGGPEAEPEVG